METEAPDRSSRMIYVKGIIVILGLSSIVAMHVFLKMSDDAEALLRGEVLASIQRLGAEASVVIDGRSASQPKDVLIALGKLAAHQGHRSYPQETFHVIIGSGAESVKLELGRDSEIRDEYWVSVWSEESGAYRFIGSLRTDVFDQYPRDH